MSGPGKMIRNIMTLGLWTLVSRGAGLARDLMMANYLGAGAVADAFNVAFSLPNMFRRFFAEGAFNQAFVPIYAKKLEAGEDAETFAQDAFAGLSAVADGIFLARDLVNEPPNILHPEEFARRAKTLLTKLGVKVEILGEAEMKKQGRTPQRGFRLK